MSRTESHDARDPFRPVVIFDGARAFDLGEAIELARMYQQRDNIVLIWLAAIGGEDVRDSNWSQLPLLREDGAGAVKP